MYTLRNKLQAMAATIVVSLTLAAPLAANAASLNPIYSFVGSEGANPQANLVPGVNGSFYGTASGGGANSFGSIFQVAADGTVTTLYSFTGADDGGTPLASLLPLATNSGIQYYGTTYSGGTFGFGTIFKIAPDGTFTTVYTFTGSPDGANPQAALIKGVDGRLYGTTISGGVNGNGTVFTITPAGKLTVLHSFAAQDSNGFNTDGANPLAPLVIGRDGHFYGTTYAAGASGNGTIFEITCTGHFLTLHSFTGDDGTAPVGGLVPFDKTSFIGTTSQGGANNAGTIFRIGAKTPFTTLHTFDATDVITGVNNDGANPAAALLPYPTSTGVEFYGTALSGGVSANGTIFKIAKNGTFTTVYSFTGGADGASPLASLTFGSGGSLYGTTYTGGTYGNGSIFQLTLP